MKAWRTFLKRAAVQDEVGDVGSARYLFRCYRNRRQFASACQRELDQPRSLQNQEGEQQPASDVPMAFTGHRLMVNEDHSRDVCEPVKQFPTLCAKLADRPVVTGQRKHYQNTEPGQTEPGKRLSKALDQIIPIALIENMTREMDESVNAGGYTNVATMPVQGINNRRVWKEYPKRSQAQHGAQGPDGDFAGHV